MILDARFGINSLEVVLQVGLVSGFSGLRQMKPGLRAGLYIKSDEDTLLLQSLVIRQKRDGTTQVRKHDTCHERANGS